METKEINITYETLFDILKKEKDTADLQKLDPNFFNEFVSYIDDKKKLLEKDDSLFSEEEKKKVEKQIDNAKRLIKEIYERREKKTINMALIKSRTKSNIVDTSSFLENEKLFFNDVVKTLDGYRSTVIESVMSGKPVKINNDNPGKDDNSKKDMSSKTLIVRFLHSVPKFVGPELEEYGPFDEEDIASLPTEVAKLLISKGRVEEIKGS